MKNRIRHALLLAILLSLHCIICPIQASASSGGSYTITIVNRVGDEQRFRTAQEMFHIRYPNVSIVERRIDDPRIIATEIMAGGEGIDLVGLQDSFMTISAAMLLKSGALVDLNQYPELAQLKDNCLDLFGCVTISGKWYAVPETIDEHLFQVDTTLAAKIGWQIPDGRWSMDEFRGLAQRVKKWNETAEEHIYLLQDDNYFMPYFFQAFQANHLDVFTGRADYDSEAYIELLRMWKDLNDSELICKALNRMKPSQRSDALLYVYRSALPVFGEYTCILPPSDDELSKYPVYSCALAINSNTPHIEEAVYFMRCYLSPEALRQQFYLNYGYWLKGEEPELDPRYFYEKVSDENQELWYYVLANSAPELYLYDISRVQYNTLFPALLEDEITPERFAAVSQQLADMALGE